MKKVGTPMLKGDGYFLTALRKGEGAVLLLDSTIHCWQYVYRNMYISLNRTTCALHSMQSTARVRISSGNDTDFQAPTLPLLDISAINWHWVGAEGYNMPLQPI